MNTKLIYFDESGDDGLKPGSSDYFILTGTIVDSLDWNETYLKIIEFRKQLKIDYGFHIEKEFHTNEFLYNRNSYQKYNWSKTQRKEIIEKYLIFISSLKIQVVNVIILKKKITNNKYKVLEKALEKNIEIIESTSTDKYKYLIIADQGRIQTMRQIVNNIQKKSNMRKKNSTLNMSINICNMIEDIFEKDSKNSYYIQISDFIASFISIYYKYCIDETSIMPRRLQKTINKEFVINALNLLKNSGILIKCKQSERNYNFIAIPK